MFNKIDVSMYKDYMTKYPNGKTIFEALSETLSSYNKSVDEVNKKINEGVLKVDQAENSLRLALEDLFDELEMEYNTDFNELSQTITQNNLTFQDSISAQLAETEQEIMSFKEDYTNQRAEDILEFENLKIYLSSSLKFEIGSLSSSTGAILASYKRIRTDDFREFNLGDMIGLKDKINYDFSILLYDENQNFISTTSWRTEKYIFKGKYLAKILIRRKDESELLGIVDETGNQLFFFNANDTLKNYYSNTFLETLNMNISGGRETLYAFLPNLDGSYLSDFTFVKDELWVFPVSNDENTNFVNISRYNINVEEQTEILLGQIKHNWGHVNSVDYLPQKDTLIFGNGSGSYSLNGVIYLIENISTLKNQSQLDINDVAIKIDCSSYNLGKKFNLCWGESNRGQYNIAYLITDDNSTIRKILLGLGTNALEMGQFISGKSWNRFNGTFKILDTYHQYTIAGVEVNQGSDYDRGVLYTGIGHDGVWYWENYLQEDGTIVRKSYREKPYSTNGNMYSANTQGICVTNDYLIIGDTGTIFIQKR